MHILKNSKIYNLVLSLRRLKTCIRKNKIIYFPFKIHWILSIVLFLPIIRSDNIWQNEIFIANGVIVSYKTYCKLKSSFVIIYFETVNVYSDIRRLGLG